MQRGGELTLVSRYGEGEHGAAAEVPVFFHGAGHYDLLVGEAALGQQEQQEQPRSRL